MRFTAILRLHPESVFGLPDHKRIVVPAAVDSSPREIRFPAIDPHTLREVGHGTMSEFRKDTDAVTMDLKLRGCDASLRDNFLTITVEAKDTQDARLKIRHTVTSFLRRLEILQNVPLHYYRVKMTSDDGALDVDAERAEFGVTAYNTAELAEFVRSASDMLTVDDTTFEQGLFYFEHALLLTQRLTDLTNRFNEHSELVLSEAFLHFWKSATIILGDTTRQSTAEISKRSAALGLDSGFYDREVKPLSRIRNDSDVAHSTPDPSKIKLAGKNLGTVQELARKALKAYASYRRQGGLPFLM
jgi:hypothetical protein